MYFTKIQESLCTIFIRRILVLAIYVSIFIEIVSTGIPRLYPSVPSRRGNVRISRISMDKNLPQVSDFQYKALTSKVYWDQGYICERSQIVIENLRLQIVSSGERHLNSLV